MWTTSVRYLAGTGDADPSYRMLRGIFQALEHGLPQGHLRYIHHVTAHAGDPYNEFVDIAAKREGQQSFLHRRADLDLQKWQHIFPHLWLCFASESGLPPWRDGHLAVELPKLPSSHPCEEGHDGQGHTEVFDCTLRWASCHVLSSKCVVSVTRPTRTLRKIALLICTDAVFWSSCFGSPRKQIG